MITAGIIGANGYTGGELIRLLENHPSVTLRCIGSRSMEGMPVAAAHDSLWHLKGLKFCGVEIETYQNCDVVFLALPHGESSRYAKALIARGIKVVDLGADFRLNDYAAYTEWYASPHAWPEILADTVYGLPELYKERIIASDLVANPGCFPTSIILALAPLLEKGWIDPTFIVADSDTGVTGAGKNPTDSTHFPAIHDNLTAYKVGTHRHQAEICQELQLLANNEVGLTFTPHLVPIDRGILSTVTARTTYDLDAERVAEAYESFYSDAPFVRLRDANHLPQVKTVRGSNYCDIAPIVTPAGTIVILSAIDNLVKGAAGQAVQNMNLMFGLPETEGLTHLPLCP